MQFRGYCLQPLVSKAPRAVLCNLYCHVCTKLRGNVCSERLPTMSNLQNTSLFCQHPPPPPPPPPSLPLSFEPTLPTSNPLPLSPLPPLSLTPDALIATWREKGCTSFWKVVRQFPVLRSHIVCWKTCFVIHRSFRDGYPDVRTQFCRWDYIMSEKWKLF